MFFFFDLIGEGCILYDICVFFLLKKNGDEVKCNLFSIILLMGLVVLCVNEIE